MNLDTPEAAFSNLISTAQALAVRAQADGRLDLYDKIVAFLQCYRHQRIADLETAQAAYLRIYRQVSIERNRLKK
jgi:hypothetical protein